MEGIKGKGRERREKEGRNRGEGGREEGKKEERPKEDGGREEENEDGQSERVLNGGKKGWMEGKYWIRKVGKVYDSKSVKRTAWSEPAKRMKD